MHPNNRLTSASAAIAILVMGMSGTAQREHTRLTPNRPTTVTESQAAELTLTLTEVSVHEIQIWVRTAGSIDADHTTITAELSPAEGALLKVGQRARAFSPGTRSRMHQAFVSAVAPRADRTRVEVELSGDPLEDTRYYVVEIVAIDGERLSVPNEAIIVSGDRRTVYVKEPDGGYVPRDVTLGVQGELYAEVVEGLAEGEQVVTFGSFFIDADHKLKEP